MQGFLLINKPSGITSFGVCACLRRITGEKRIGHTGTLDPMATGVLPVFIGRPTVLSNFLLCADKRYTATVQLGIATDTDDVTGNVIKTAEPITDMAKIKEVINRFIGEQQQFPPVYSAIKKDGVALYKRARKGEDIKPEPRTVFIHSIEVLSADIKNAQFVIDVTCSKGTYIRSLCRDIGETLGCYATLAKLERTKTGVFEIESCIPLEALNEDNVAQYILPSQDALPHLRNITVTKKQAVRFSNGGALDLERLKDEVSEDEETLKVFCDSIFLGLGRVDKQEKELKVKCVITQYVI